MKALKSWKARQSDDAGQDDISRHFSKRSAPVVQEVAERLPGNRTG